MIYQHYRLDPTLINPDDGDESPLVKENAPWNTPVLAPVSVKVSRIPDLSLEEVTFTCMVFTCRGRRWPRDVKRDYWRIARIELGLSQGNGSRNVLNVI